VCQRLFEVCGESVKGARQDLRNNDSKRAMSYLERISRISTLELPECDMKGQDAERLAGVLAQCPALAHLDLSDNYIFGSAGAERFAGVLGQCRELVHLNLCRITTLELRNCAITGPPAMWLAVLAGTAAGVAQCLVHLDLSGRGRD
jgi:hypothetical protein